MKRIAWPGLVAGVAWLSPTVVGAAPPKPAVAVTAAKKAQLSSALREVLGLDCPPSGIEVATQRRFGDDRVYVLDACGTKVEIEEGLVVPESFAEIPNLSDDEMDSLAANLSKLHVAGIPASLRAKVAAWCSEPSARLEGEGVAACRQRLPTEVRPVGADIREKGENEYWYAVRNRPFTVRTGWYLPVCNRSVLGDTPEACRCRGGEDCAELADTRESSVRRVVRDAGETEGAPAASVIPDGRGEFGISYLRTSVDRNDTYRGVGFGAATFLGLRFLRAFAIAGGASLQSGWQLQDVEWQECDEFAVCRTQTSGSQVSQVGIWIRARVYPLLVGFHLDAAVGGVHAWQSYRRPRESDTGAGPAVFFGVGYETMMDERWSFGVNARQTLLLGTDLSGSATDFFLTLAVKD
jgi:hypothetical protein